MKILVFQHLGVEHPGVFREFWHDDGHEWLAVELDEGQPIPALDGFDLLVAMGGPMDTWQEDRFAWLTAEKAAIRRWIRELERPFLGICLGHQLMADALGGTVTKMRHPEVGLASVTLTSAGRDDTLLRGLPDSIETVQWHGAEVSALPDGAIVLASNDACRTQAMRWGRFAYGLQFHVEVTPTTVADWVAIPEYKASLETALGPTGAGDLDRDVAARLSDFRRTAHVIGAKLSELGRRG